MGVGHLFAAQREGFRAGDRDHVASPGREAAEALARREVEVIEIVGFLGNEALLHGLLRDAHVLADLGPGRAGAAGLVDEMADQMVGHLTEMLGGLDRVCEVGQRVTVGMLLDDVGDEIVQPYRVFVHASTIG